MWPRFIRGVVLGATWASHVTEVVAALPGFSAIIAQLLLERLIPFVALDVRRSVWALSKYFPNVKTFVRAHDVDHGLILEKAGATAVVPETLEPSLQLAAAVLAQVESLYPEEMGPNIMHVEDFLVNGLPLLDKGIQERVERASSNGNVLRYVCVIEDSSRAAVMWVDEQDGEAIELAFMWVDVMQVMTTGQRCSDKLGLRLELGSFAAGVMISTDLAQHTLKQVLLVLITLKRYTSSENTTGFCRSSQLKFADFSFNFFVGSIPKCLDYLPRSSFQGNCLQDRDPKQRSTARCAEAPPATSHSGVNQNHWHGQDGIMNEEAPKPALASKPAWLLALEIVTGTMVGSLFIVGLLIALQRC
ncbi:hypothetical protein HYC85_024353 [Camellia sinensis]|uniref:Uncharacterized protein n=1 Tax=Camellia sinensis TaxID=4442 RepID=A0A7J7G892_CAMSI|nr:hypothetical protein HYC85_024353 [Camellia sinensis]